MITLQPYPYTNSLVENFQALDIKFAFTKEISPTEHKQLMPWVKCREYFNELLMKNHHPEEFEFVKTYGFDYKHEEFPLDLTQTTIALKFPKAHDRDTFLENLKYLHDIENHNGIENTQMSKVEKDTMILILKASKFWIQKALLLNIYTMVLKLLSLGYPDTTMENVKKEFIDPYGRTPTELYYLEQCSAKTLDKVFSNLSKIADIPTKYVDGRDTLPNCGTTHAESGVVTILTQPQTYSLKKFQQDVLNILTESPQSSLFFKDVA